MIQCTLIVGDINLSGTNWEAMDSNDNYESEILDKLIESNFSNISNQTLDVFLTNNPHPVIECYQHQNLDRSFEVNKKQCSDHLPILTSVVFLGTIVKNSNTCRKFAFKRADWKKLNQAIKENAFKPFCFSNVDALLNQWYTCIRHHINNHIPKVMKHRAALPPWASKETSHMIMQLNTKKKAWKNLNPSRLLKLKKLEKQILKQLDIDLDIFEDKIFSSRRFSSIQKYLKCIRKPSVLPATIKFGNEKASSDSEKATLFNLFFKSVYNSKEPSQMIYTKSKLNFIKTSRLEIEELSQNLDMNKSTGPDNLGNIILRNCAKTLSKSLLLLFQTILNKEIFPELWKLSQITPVYKEGSKADVNCYRPISLLCCVSKLLERIVFNRIYSHCKDNLFENQFGFRQRRSATTQLLLFLNSLYAKLDDVKTKELSVLY